MIKKYKSLFFVLLVLTIGASAQYKNGDSPAQLISAIEFDVSPEDRLVGIEGTMKISVEIDKTGEVTDSVVFVGPSWPCSVDLDKRIETIMRNAENAFREYQFVPAIKNGEPVKSRIDIPIMLGQASGPKAPRPIADPKLVNGGVVNGKATSLPKPGYPDKARSARASGTVSVQVLIGEDGKVIRAQVIDGSPLFMFVSRAAACRATFSTTHLQAKVSGVIIYNFVP